MNIPVVSRVATVALTAIGLSIGLSITVGLSKLHGSDKRKSNTESPPPVILPRGFRVQDIDARQLTLLGAPDCHGVGLVFFSTECPRCNEAIPPLNKMAATYKKLGVDFYGVISDRSVTRVEARCGTSVNPSSLDGLSAPCSGRVPIAIAVNSKNRFALDDG